MTLDAAGNVTRVTEGGGPLSTGEAVLHRGLAKQRLINVGAAGRPFVTHNYGEIQIPRSGLGLILPTGGAGDLAGKDGRFLPTYPGAPAGTLTLRFDLAAKIKAEADRFGDLAQSLRGISQGPNYNVTGIPGEPDRAIGVCEYGYFISKLDFSRLATEKKVYKEYLPLPGGGAFPAAAGLGPYNSAWVRQDDGLWLYYLGYTGMSRLRYPQDGGYAVDLFHPRLQASPVDGHPRNSVKDFLHLIPSLDDSLVNIGRGRSGRGGGAMSAGLEKFDPKTLGPSQTAVFLNRACNLYTPAARVVISAKDGKPQQEIFAAGGLPRAEYIQDLPEPLRPVHTGPKVYAYQVSADGNLAPRFGFSLPPLPEGKESRAHVALSPCRQYLVILQEGGSLYSYHLGENRFVDGLSLQDEGGKPVPLVEFERPSTFLWTAPGGEIFFLAAGGNGVTFHQVLAAQDGALTVRPHLSIAWKGGESSVAEFQSVVKGFIESQDGSLALALGGSQEKGSTFVRYIADFIPPARTRK